MEAAVSNRRRVLAGVLGAIGLMAVAAVIFFITRGSTDPVADSQAATPTAVLAPVNPPTAPAQPISVELERLGVTAIRVSWEPGDDDIEGVEYEVRRQDVDNFETVRTTQTHVMLPGISAGESPCVTIMAVRSTRISAATEASCLAPKTGGYVEVRPSTCQQGNCEVRAVLNGFAANSQVAVLVQDPDGFDINDFGFIYENRVDTDARGKIDSWRLKLPPLLGPGNYVVVVADDVGETFSALLTVTE